MARADINYDSYKVKAFLDSNIILEGLPLNDLPWEEIDLEGPIIALIAPSVMKEVDSKKFDGRIGKKAREFNRFISPVAAGGEPLVLREENPRVELALFRSTSIPWDQYDDLEPEDGDSCIVAEIIHARDMNHLNKLVVSHDIKPIAFATSHDISTLHVSDSWLRQIEPHPKERMIQKLNHEIAEYKSKEPSFEITIEILKSEPINLLCIENLSKDEADNFLNQIIEKNPRKRQSTGSGVYEIHNHDYSYDGKFDAYQKRIPTFVEKYPENMEVLLNQVGIRVVIRNTGNFQADNLLMEVDVTGGLIHDRYVFVSPTGPRCPQPQTGLFAPQFDFPGFNPRPGRHEVIYKDSPRFEKKLSITCEDFRPGQEYVFEGIVLFDVRSKEQKKIQALASASNFRGLAESMIEVETKTECHHISHIVDLETLQMKFSTPILELIRNRDWDAVDFEIFDKDGNE